MGGTDQVVYAEELYVRRDLLGRRRELYRLRVPVYIQQPTVDPAQLVEGFLAALKEMRADIRLDRTRLYEALERLAIRSNVPVPDAKPEWLGRLDYDPAHRPYAKVDYDQVARQLLAHVEPAALPPHSPKALEARLCR